MRSPTRARSRATPDPGVDVLEVLVAAMVLTYVWRFHDLLPGLRPFRLLFVSAALAGLAWVVQTDPRRTLARLKTRPSRYLVALVGVMFLSVPGSVFKAGSLGFLVYDFSKTLFFAVVVAASIRSFRNLERLGLVFVAGSLVYAAYSLFKGFGGARLMGIGYDPNDMAALLVVSIPFAVYFLSTPRRGLVKLLALAALVVAVVAVVRTVSRGGLLGLIAVGGYVLLFARSIPVRTRVFASALGFATLLFIAAGPYWDQMSTILEPSQDYNVQNQATGRVAIWKRGVGYMLRRPLFGVGLSQFGTAEGRLSEIGQARAMAEVGFKWSAPHNSFVEVGAELGVTGLVLFLGIFVTSVRELKRIRNRPGTHPGLAPMTHALTGSLVGYATAGFFLSHAYYPYVYFLFAMVIGLIKLYPEDAVATRRSRRRTRRPQRARVGPVPVRSPP